MKEAPGHICPKCCGDVPNTEHKGEYPGALSRLDNETEICSACGQAEALEYFKNYYTNAGEDVGYCNVCDRWIKITPKRTLAMHGTVGVGTPNRCAGSGLLVR